MVVSPMDETETADRSVAEPGNRLESTHPTPPANCPLCGRSLTTVTIRGPMEGIVSPCGCRLPPKVLLDG